MNETKNVKQKWHNIPREDIKWHPTVDTEMCIGCGICVLGCGPKVFRFDFENMKAVVVEPFKCKVGCVTCANTCPVTAISFPSLSYLHKILKSNKVISTSKKELDALKNQFSI